MAVLLNVEILVERLGKGDLLHDRQLNDNAASVAKQSEKDFVNHFNCLSNNY